MLAAASMSDLAFKFLPSLTAVIKEFLINLIPSIAIPSAIGWKPGAQKASRLCAKASMPVAAVNRGERSTVKTGSKITIDGKNFG